MELSQKKLTKSELISEFNRFFNKVLTKAKAIEAIVKTLLRRIPKEEEVGEFELPKLVESLPGETRLSVSPSPCGRYKGFRVLLADDEGTIREGFGCFLRNLGFTLFLAKDGAEAIEIIKSQKLDLIITDIRMPKADGIEVFHRAREIQPDVPLIFITAFGYDYRHQIAKAKREGLKNVFLKEKPINLAHLEDIIHKVLKGRRGDSKR